MTVEQQCDPRAKELYDQLKAGNEKVMGELIAILRSDFPTYCALLLKVKPKGGGVLKPFLFNQAQRYVWAKMCELKAQGQALFLVILKFRQAGMSTFWDAWIYWQMWRQKDIASMIVAHQVSTAETMIETMRVFYDEMPPIFRPELRDGNHGATIPRGEMYFADRRSWTMIHVAKNVDPRGQQVTHVLETEYSSYDDPDELNGALLPQLPPFGSAERLESSFVIESTPKGQNEFYELYKDAKEGKNYWHPICLCWWMFDEQYSAPAPASYRMTKEEKSIQRQLSRVREKTFDGKPVSIDQMYWRRMTIESDYRGDENKFQQEYIADDESCWLLGSKSIFREHAKYLQANVRYMEDEAIAHFKGLGITTSGPVWGRIASEVTYTGNFEKREKQKFVPHAHGKWIIWETPIPGDVYVVGGDPAGGFEDGDNSVACVINVTKARQVAEYAAKTSPENFASDLADVGFFYNTALLVPEVNTIGYVVLTRLLAKISYPNVYRWPKFDEVNRFTHKRGFVTTHQTKQLMVSSMVNAIEEESLVIASRELLAEMSTFEQSGEGEFEAQKGRHDDRVMAFGLAMMGIMQTPKLSAAFLSAQSRIPSAANLGLTGIREVPDTPLPKQIQKLVEQRISLSWHPMGGEFDAF